jgi:hypothetical protein
MKSLPKTLLLIVVLIALLPACGGAAATPALGVTGQPTLVFVFTDP